MTQYFIRRLLLTIPTFIGCTIIVFFIVQLAPGGPLDQQLMALRMGSGAEGGGGARGETGAMIPESTMESLREYYQLDKSLPERYLVWLGLMSRPVNNVVVKDAALPFRVGGITVRLDGAPGNYRLVEAGNGQHISDWTVEEKTLKDGTKRIRVFQTEHSGILTGNFGDSSEYREPVGDLIMARMNVSLQYGLIGLILSYTVCVYLGIQKALRHGSPFDVASSVLVFIGYSVPGWALGLLLLVLLGGGSFDIFPLGSFQSRDYETLSFIDKLWDRAMHAVLPTIAYTIAGFASLTVLMKNSILENVSQDYVRTAFAKGLRERRVIWVHVLRNSIIPIASRIGFIIGSLITGSYFIEWVFNIDGIGKLSYQAILSRDYNIVFAFTVITVLIQLFGAIISDFVLAMVDPRIRFK